jgi:hypothetical protein
MGAWILLAIGVGTAAVGLLPWIVTGMRLPLQNLWASAPSPEDMPIGLLPFSQYSITLIAAVLVVGATIAGIVARSTRSRQTGGGFITLVAGVLAVQIVAIMQTASVVRSGLLPGRESTIYLVAVCAVAAVSCGVGALVLFLVARAPRAGALVGLSIGAVASGWWVDALIVPSAVTVSTAQMTALDQAHLVPAALCGAAIAWCGVGTAGRIAAALAAVAVLAIGPAFATAVTAAAGTRALARYPSEMADYALQVFQQAIVSPELTFRPVAATAVIALVGLVGVAALRRQRRGGSASID